MFQIINERKIKHLSKKQWFELNDIRELYKGLNFYIIKGRKNIGKTYAILNEMEKIAKEGKKFILMRITEGEVKTLKSEWSNDTSIPFVFKGNRIYYINENEVKVDCGLIAHAKNLQSLRSLQYNDYVSVFFDEYVAFNEKVYGSDDIAIARQFIQFIMDFQRNKNSESLEIWCFGNNNIPVDIFTKYFKLNINECVQVDLESKCIYVNLKNSYAGVKNSIAKGLAFYDKALDDYLLNNNTMVDVSKLTNYLKENESFIRFGFIYNGLCYLYLQRGNKYKEGKEKKIQLVNEYIITHSDFEDLKKHLVYAIGVSDGLMLSNAMLLPRSQVIFLAED